MPYPSYPTGAAASRNVDPRTYGSLTLPGNGPNPQVPQLRSVPTVTPVGQQADAVDAVVRWYTTPGAPQVFRFFGYAGTGKTTLAQHIVGLLNLRNVKYAAFSGKAAHVLRQKGCDGAQTIHSLVYAPVPTSRAELDRLNKLLAETEDELLADAIRAMIRVEEQKLDRPLFQLQEESDLEAADLLVLDEASMVSDTVMKDLLAFGVPVLALGDPAQLPPVAGAGGLIDGKPDVLLTELHRSAADSPVTRIATASRNAAPNDWNLGVYGPDGDSGRRTDIRAEHLLAFDQVLVGTNACRWNLIARMRAQLGRSGERPEPGDRIMALVNSPDAGVLNGMQFVVLQVEDSPDHSEKLELIVQDEEGGERDLLVWKTGFRGLAGEKDAKRHGRSRTAVVTYAHAITVHKSQGSQWDRVLVVDESRTFRGMTYKQMVATRGHEVASLEAHLAARRWLYTAVTRAAQQVVLVDSAQVA